MSVDPSLAESSDAVLALGVGRDLRNHISDLEHALTGKSRAEAVELVEHDGIDGNVLRAALAIKAMAGQINVVVHVLGILVSLPYLLDEGEVIESVSLGAGNTGRLHDLETDRRVAEFKFIRWRGGAEAIRQNSLFVDLFNLASSNTDKQRQLIVVGKTEPLRFLNNNRSIRSVLSKHSTVKARFDHLHQDEQLTTVRQYWAKIQGRVDLIDLVDLVPTFGSATIELLEAGDGT